MQEYTPEVEVFSIDEAFLDITRSVSLFGSPERIAWLLKARIRESFNITCSVGIAPNKLLAKLASDMQKPDGLTIIRPEESARVMERLPVQELCGIGKKMQRHLNMMSIYTCGELGRCDEVRLTRRFGIIGKRLKLMGQGIDDAPVIPADREDDVKSVGHSMTLERDIDRREDILRFLLRLSEMVGQRARRYGVAGRTVSLSVRYADFFTSWSRQTTVGTYINLSHEIYTAALSILDSVELEQPIRLMGVTLSALSRQARQMSLFAGERKRGDVTRAMDEVNARFGTMSVMFGTVVPDRGNQGSFVISPAWRPNGIRNVDVR